MSTIETTGCSKPLAIRVTDAAHETLFLRSLLRQTVPVLRNPDDSVLSYRRDLAARIERAVGMPCPESPGDDGVPPLSDREAPPEDEYEPGCELTEGLLRQEEELPPPNSGRVPDRGR